MDSRILALFGWRECILPRYLRDQINRELGSQISYCQSPVCWSARQTMAFSISKVSQNWWLWWLIFFNVNLFLREVELTCNVVLASDLQQVDSIIFFFQIPFIIWGFPWDSDGKESACSAEDPDLVPNI